MRSAKSTYGAKGTWARTGALILFLVSAILLLTSLNENRRHASADAMLKVGTGIGMIHHYTKTKYRT
ncbi:MAG TPA: hypothetical protein VFF87_03880 [Hyphomicrobium sp.]|nr:hypothetical protein [Hyphomicrobium sp.]